EEPVEAHAIGHIGAESQVDEWAAGTLRFASGVVATFQTATRCAQPTLVAICGDQGRIEVLAPWHPDPANAKVRLVVGDAEETLTVGDGLKAFAREALEMEKHLADRQVPK